MNKKHFILLMIISLNGCTTEKKPEPISNQPQIINANVNPTSVKAFTDSLIVNIRYRDGDGDLGSDKRDEFNLFINDLRLEKTNEMKFRIPRLAPEGSKIAIEGNLKIVLKNILLTDDTLPSERVKFSVRLKDRAGNESNVHETNEIIVRAF